MYVFFRRLMSVVFSFVLVCMSSCRESGSYKCAKIFVFVELQKSHSSANVISDVLRSCSMSDGTFDFSVTQTAEDKNGILLVPDPIQFGGQKQRMIQQCGLYDFTFSLNGDVKRISKFKYSGENTVLVQRGAGWSVYITREDWDSLIKNR